MAFDLHRTTRKGTAFPQLRGYHFWLGRECASQRRTFLERRRYPGYSGATAFGNRSKRWASSFVGRRDSENWVEIGHLLERDSET